MAVAFDAKPSADLLFTGVATATIGPGGSGTFVPGASASAVIGLLNFSSAVSPSAVGMTWNAVSMTLVPNTDTGNVVQTNHINRSLIFALGSPATGSGHNLTASWTTNSTGYMEAMSVTGSDTTTPCKNGTTITGAAGTSPSINVNSPTNDLAVGGFTTDGDSPQSFFNGANVTLATDNTGATGNAAWAYTAGAGASTTISNTLLTTAAGWVMSACDIQVPASGDVLHAQIWL